MSGPDDAGLLDEQRRYYEARAPEYDDWFFRRGRYDRGDEASAAWFAELAQVRGWLAELPLDGADVLELAPGTGLWTAELAARAGRLGVVEASAAMWARARERLGPRADAIEVEWADLFAWRPGKAHDALVAFFWISHVPDARLGPFLAAVAAALRPGGSVFFLDGRRDERSSAADHVLPGAGEETMVRRLDDGQEFRVVKRFRGRDELARAFAEAGLVVEVHETASFFQAVLGRRDA